MSTQEMQSGANGGEGQALPPGYILKEYRIIKSIGSGGFGITYLGMDENLQKQVAIKEYFPFHLAFRGNNSIVAPRTQSPGDVDEYSWGRERFIEEAQTLAKFEHPNVIRVIRYIPENGSAYIIMDFADGQPLNKIIKASAPLSGEQVTAVIEPLMDGLTAVHQKGILHRDVKPGNIIIREDNTPILIDFGAARQAIGSKSKSLSAILTPHFAPIEQYSTRGNQGPWTDIYSLGAVAYLCLTGQKPPEATERMRTDPYVPLVKCAAGRAPQAFLEAIDWALDPEEEKRPQSVEEWRRAMSGGAIPTNAGPTTANADDDRTVIASAPSQHQPAQYQNATAAAGIGGVNSATSISSTAGAKSGLGAAPIILGAVGLAAAGALAYFALNLGGSDDETTLSAKSEPEPIEQQPADTITLQVAPPETVTPAANALAVEAGLFDNAREINTPEAMEVFIRLYPNGANTQAAKERLDALRASGN